MTLAFPMSSNFFFQYSLLRPQSQCFLIQEKVLYWFEKLQFLNPKWLENEQQPGIRFLGEVPDAHEFILKHPIMVVPLVAGSGIRVKILEAMALGRVVVTTSLGAEGIDAKDKAAILIADDEQAFTVAILELLQAPKTVQQIGIRARVFIENNFDNDKLGKQLKHFFEKLVA